MHRLTSSLSLFALLTFTQVTPTAETGATDTVTGNTPDVIGTAWVKTLRRNDLVAGLFLLTATDQAQVSKQWQKQISRPDAYADLQIDTVLRMAQESNGADQLIAMTAPYLGNIEPQALAKQIIDVAGILTMAAGSQPANATNTTSTGLDYAGLRDWLKDLAAWVPKAGLTDQTKTKLAMTHIVNAITLSGLHSAAEIRAMPLPVLLSRLGPALPKIKEALAVFGVQVDALLDSMTFKLTNASAQEALIAITFTSLDKPRAVALKLVQKDGSWELASGNDNPLTGLSQLVMMALLMQGMENTTPTPPPVAPVDDGAL
jgi:hypothetical protein